VAEVGPKLPALRKDAGELARLPALRETHLRDVAETRHLMGYYFKSQYRGDFYRRPRGDYYAQRGDFWDDLVSGVSDVAGGIGSALGTVGGAVLRQLPSVFAKPYEQKLLAGGPAPELGATNIIGPTVGRPPASFMIQGTGNPTRPSQQTLTIPAARRGTTGARRRMNPLNLKALRRGLRRAAGFQRIAQDVLKLTRPGVHVDGFKKHHAKRKAKLKIG